MLDSRPYKPLFAVITTDLELSEFAPMIERRLAQAAGSVTPDEFKTLLGDPGRAMLRATMESVGGDSTSIWLADIAEDNLIVTHSSPEESFIGWKQPVTEGLISLVFASEQSLCENKVYQNANHSKRVDDAMDQVTCALIATPFYFGGALQGVVSCVQLKDGLAAEDPSGFSARHLARIRRLSTVLERLVNYRLLTTLIGLEL
ncbi:MAG: hypothetical protein P1U86_00590 [Verrucomicrobiales bacterium]|nr:hypothetical protein [Verrucomicrobiales bacterium]